MFLTFDVSFTLLPWHMNFPFSRYKMLSYIYNQQPIFFWHFLQYIILKTHLQVFYFAYIQYTLSALRPVSLHKWNFIQCFYLKTHRCCTLPEALLESIWQQSHRPLDVSPTPSRILLFCTALCSSPRSTAEPFHSLLMLDHIVPRNKNVA